MPIPAKLLLTDPAERRLTQRRSLDLDATLRDASQAPLDVKVHNLSTGGFLVEAEINLAVGDDISIGIGGLGVCPALVVRAGNQLYGCEFDRPISHEDVAQAAAAEVHRLQAEGEPKALFEPEPIVESWPAQVPVGAFVLSAALLWLGIVAGAKALMT